MPRPQKPFVVRKRKDSGTFILTINPVSGVPSRVCQEWVRRGFLALPPELAHYRVPKNRAAAEAGALALVSFLKKPQAAIKAVTEQITVGEWLKKFTSIEESPKAARNVAKNRPYSVNTIIRYEGLYRVYIQGDLFSELLMSEVEELDALAFIGRLARREMAREDLKEKYKLGGTETFAKIVKFVRIAFKTYQKGRPRWLNAFRDIEAPKGAQTAKRDALEEDEIMKLFSPGVLQDTMELAVCCVMFLSGLRKGEIFALKPENLDWYTPKINVRRAWQDFYRKSREIGPTKGKKDREAPFDTVLQGAIRKLWEENGQHEYVFSFANGKTPGPSWIRGRFRKWITRSNIILGGRNIVPHSARHSLASLLEARGVSLRYIQELLGHSDLQTTIGYLHTPSGTIREIGKKIGDRMNENEDGQRLNSHRP